MQKLPRPARYIPLEKGVYEVAPGLFPFGHDFGNGEMDRKIFQIDEDFETYLANRDACRAENIAKYYQERELSPAVQTRVNHFLLERLVQEWPQFFKIIVSENKHVLTCNLTGDRLEFNSDGALISPSKYVSGIDSIMSQTQEDLAVVVDDGQDDRLALLYVCGPSHWSPEAKIGLNFANVHVPIPGFEKMARSSRALVQAMINKGPFVRFVWSFVTDKNINHHPEAPAGKDPILWKGRAFQPANQTPFYLRVERQITYGLPDVNAALFFIRVSFVDGNEIKAHPEWNRKLVSSLESMSPESRKYKGVEHCFNDLVGWLRK